MNKSMQEYANWVAALVAHWDNSREYESKTFYMYQVIFIIKGLITEQSLTHRKKDIFFSL